MYLPHYHLPDLIISVDIKFKKASYRAIFLPTHFSSEEFNFPLKRSSSLQTHQTFYIDKTHTTLIQKTVNLNFFESDVKQFYFKNFPQGLFPKLCCG